MNHLAAPLATWPRAPTRAEQAGLKLRRALGMAFSRWGALALLGAALLGAFQHVVGESVVRGQALGYAMATQADALWRCNDLRGVQVRADCRGQLRAAQGTAPVAPAP